MKHYTQEELYWIANNMIEYGGSFVKAIGVALKRADVWNARKLAKAFPEYFAQYEKENWETGRV